MPLCERFIDMGVAVKVEEDDLVVKNSSMSSSEETESVDVSGGARRGGVVRVGDNLGADEVDGG